MFAIQRSEAILKLIKEKGIVQVNELVKLFNVSDVTVRKDLNKLQKDGLIIKTHGGAVLNNNISTPPAKSHDNTVSTSNPKEALAQFAYQYIQKGDTIFLGSGYTCTALAKHISREDDVSIITNNIEASLLLKEKCRTLILIGGEVVFYDNHSFTTSTQIDEYLKSYNINKAITSCSAIDMNFGVSVSTEVSRHIISAILKVSHSWYLLVDHSKFNLVSPYKVADISSVETIITDSKLPEYASFDNITGISNY